MLKKVFTIICTILLLSGCSSKTSKTEITFWTLQMADFVPYINTVISNYEKNNPNVKIKWVDVPFSEGEKRTLVAVMTNNPPDLINLNPDFSALLAQKGTLAEIDAGELKDFVPEVIEALKYENKIYSIPWYATSAITIYNKDLLKKSGIKTLPKTYDELASASEQIKQKTGAYSYIPTITENDTMIKILNKYGINNPSDFASKQAIDIFERYKKLYQNSLIPPETITMTHREALEQYMAGKVVVYQGGANFLNMIKENAPKIYEQTDVAEQLKGSVGQNDFSVMNFVIPLRAKNKTQAIDFCLYLTNEENQLELAKLTNIIATNSKTLNNEFYKNTSNLTSKARCISAKQIQNITPSLKQRKSQKEINTLVNTTVQSILLNKDNTEVLLKKLVQNISEY